jgi:acetylornithine deacetylase/succinyl-diaminopimelate desuccinylase-like protein
MSVSTISNMPPPTFGASSGEPSYARALLSHPRVARALAWLDAHVDEITREQIRLCEIPAPPFGEAARAAYVRDRFREIGLARVHTDGIGNVRGWRPGRRPAPVVVLAAHLDTIFPPETVIRVRHEDGRLYAPGISDNACGLAALLALGEALNAAAIQTEGSLLFLGTVGEEGEGDLRGVRYLFEGAERPPEVHAFIALEGAGTEGIVHCALGSRRYRLHVRGPGGHSWGDFGTPNPIHPLVRTALRLMSYPLPDHTSVSLTRIAGGEAINAIPQTAYLDVDVRSTSPAEIARIERYLREALDHAVRVERLRQHGARARGDLQYRIEVLGNRPAGMLPPDAEIVRIAWDITQQLGRTPRLECASTDANLPIALGVPAIAIGTGGEAGDVHTLQEWYAPTGRALGLKRALLIALAVVGLQA